MDIINKWSNAERRPHAEKWVRRLFGSLPCFCGAPKDRNCCWNFLEIPGVTRRHCRHRSLPGLVTSPANLKCRSKRLQSAWGVKCAKRNKQLFFFNSSRLHYGWLSVSNSGCYMDLKNTKFVKHSFFKILGPIHWNLEAARKSAKTSGLSIYKGFNKGPTGDQKRESTNKGSCLTRTRWFWAVSAHMYCLVMSTCWKWYVCKLTKISRSNGIKW